MAKNLNFIESLAKISAGSNISAFFRGDHSDIDYMVIELSGPLALIPSLKNQKIVNTNLLRPIAKAHLHLMTTGVQSIFKLRIPRFKEKTKVFCLVLLTSKSTSDEDNTLTTIKDWLEPSLMRKKERGWGIGVVDNDRNINAFAIKKSKEIKNNDTTEIYLFRNSLVDKNVIDFVKNLKEIAI